MNTQEFNEELSKYWKEYLHDEKNKMEDRAAFYAFVNAKISFEIKKLLENKINNLPSK
jgi:hypothetical protein